MNSKKKLFLASVSTIGVIFLFCGFSKVNKEYWRYKNAELEFRKESVNKFPMDSILKNSYYQVKFEEMKVPKDTLLKIEKPRKFLLEYEQNIGNNRTLIKFEAENPTNEERAAMYQVFDMEVDKIRNTTLKQNFELKVKE